MSMRCSMYVPYRRWYKQHVANHNLTILISVSMGGNSSARNGSASAIINSFIIIAPVTAVQIPTPIFQKMYVSSIATMSAFSYTLLLYEKRRHCRCVRFMD